jgi:hypothetical protein
MLSPLLPVVFHPQLLTLLHVKQWAKVTRQNVQPQDIGARQARY